MKHLSRSTLIASLVLIAALAVPLPCVAQAPAQAKAAAATPPPAVIAAQSQGVVVPADYVIGAEDVIGVLFWREMEMSVDAVVRPDGRITVPLLGDIQVLGKKPEALKTEIEKAAGKYLTDANATIVIRQINSRKVFITGQVGTPNAYPLTGPRTVLQLIAMAGGVAEYADSEHITIIRPDPNNPTAKPRVFKFNYKDVSKGKRLEQNILLQPGDTVTVP